MSLLLDALKRAEQEKLARADRPDLQVVPDSPARPEPRPAVAANSLELQPLGGTPAPSAAPSKAAGSGHSPQQAAQAVFQAKTAGASAAAAGKPRRGMVYAAIGLLAVLVIAGGAYVWHATRSLSSPVPGRLAPPPPSAPAPATPTAGAGAIIPLPPAAPTAAPATGVPAKAAPTGTAPPAAPLTEATSREALVRQITREAPAQREPALKLDRTQEAPRVPAEITRGYEALRSSDLGTARSAYQSALAANPTSLDANLGLATVEARAGNHALAVQLYRKALEADPRNATALGALANLADPVRPGAAEAQLREDLLRAPENGALHFALGNLLSSQARWSEAQSEFFEAHRLDPANPDIAHNLAVSLDHLGQGRLAATYYRRALESARTQAAQFDPSAVGRRLSELAP